MLWINTHWLRKLEGGGCSPCSAHVESSYRAPEPAEDGVWSSSHRSNGQSPATIKSIYISGDIIWYRAVYKSVLLQLLFDTLLWSDMHQKACTAIICFSLVAPTVIIQIENLFFSILTFLYSAALVLFHMLAQTHSADTSTILTLLTDQTGIALYCANL